MSLSNIVPLRVNLVSFHTSWVHVLDLLRTKADVAGLDRTRDPTEDLSWMALGYTHSLKIYREEQWFEDFVLHPLRTKADILQKKLSQLQGMRLFEKDLLSQAIVDMYITFTVKACATPHHLISSNLSHTSPPPHLCPRSGRGWHHAPRALARVRLHEGP